MKNNFKNSKAITLIALIITIVILIILAGVVISLSLGNNGLFNKAKDAKEQYLNAQNYEESQIGEFDSKVDRYTGDLSISLNRTKVNFGKNSTTFQLQANTNNKSVTWSTIPQNTTIVTVSNTGLITKGELGQAIVRCTLDDTDGEVYADCIVNVSNQVYISDRQDLEDIANDLSGEYILTNDIDLGSADWEKIGPFAGAFDGNGYTIKNLKGDALFSMASNSTLKNTKFENIQAPVVNGANGSTNVKIEKVGVVSGDLSNAGNHYEAPFTNFASGGARISYVFKDCYTRAITNARWNFAGLFVFGSYDGCYSTGTSNAAMNCHDAGYSGTYSNCFCNSTYGTEPYSGLYGISDFSNVATFTAKDWDFKSGNSDTDYIWEMVDGYPELKIFADRQREKTSQQ